MRGRLYVGVAVLIGAMSMGGEAEAALQCSDFRNMARQSSDLQEVRDLRTRANGCSPGVINDIDRRIQLLTGETADDKPEENAPTPSVATPVATTPAAIRPLTIGQTVNGRLSAASAVDAASGVAYEYWTFQAPAGQRLQVTMTATDAAQLDTYLVVGRMRGTRFEDIASNDDRGDGTFNSQLRFTPEEAGTYAIRARSFGREQYGAYSLLVEASTAPTTTAPRPLSLGEVRTGSLTPNSAVDPEAGYAFDLWTFQAEAGQRLQASMTSDNFDTYLVAGRMRAGQFEEIASNDDRGDGTLNSVLRFVPEEAGEYMLRARSYGQDQFGDYEVLVQSTSAPVAARIPLDRNANAWVSQGELSSESAGDYADFEFQAVRGRRYSVRVISNEFSPVVDIGRIDGARLAEVSFADGERQPDIAEFSAETRGGYILRVRAPTMTGGRFDLLINEVR